MPEQSSDSAATGRHHPKPPHTRIALDGGDYVVTHGINTRFWQDVYHNALTVRWPVFFGLTGLLFLVLNCCFALLFLHGDHAIANQSPPGFLGAFFFSVETLATVGYGDMHPATVYGHAIATIEIFVGMSGVALTTGIIFARFSRPHARIMFAKHPVVRPIDGRMTLMVRAANARLDVISEATARMRLLRPEVSAEGYRILKLHDLALVRDHHPIFQLGWTVMHVIDEKSPLYGESAESFAGSDSRLLLSVAGTDDTAQPMSARRTWDVAEIRWQHRYVDLMFEEEGVTHLDYAFFDDVLPL
jgi:inward rectifier potassium channel